ncbi:MAG: type I DNA topoisomerase [Planctomycetota bacterium]
MAKKQAKRKTGGKAAAKRTSRSSGKSGKALVIVESGAKAKTISKFLGKGYTIKPCNGHVRDLVSRGKGSERFGIDIEQDYKPRYQVISGREKVLDQLNRAAEGCETVYLASDPDREGEAIAWHLTEAMHLPKEKTRRITFNAITKREVSQAIESPREIDMNLVNAQTARRVLDRLVGFSLSPLLWKKVTKGLSAGRVQSVAVRLVVEREKEIQAFVPEEYWRITASLSEPDAKAKKDRFAAVLVEWKGQKLWLGDKSAKDKAGLRTQDDAEAVLAALEGADYAVRDIQERQNTRKAPPPFITSTMQQAASTFLRFGTDKTMRVAQGLYEGVEVDGSPVGLITYMRTDSFRIAPEAVQEARGYIGDHYDGEYLPEKPNFFSSKKGAQDAHEAVRPTNVAYTPERLKPFLSNDQYRLYDLIWRRFVASQMAPARYLNTTVTIAAGEGVFEAKGRKVVFDGYTVLGAGGGKAKKKKQDDGDDETADASDQELPHIDQGDALRCHELLHEQNFTKPPARYSEASLVRALEAEGIGRPSTYAPIVKTIQERGYVRLEKRAFHATELGIGVTELLLQGFPDIMDYRFTAGMEEDLDRVEEGKEDWVRIVDGFYKPFEKKLEEAGEHLEPLKGKPAPNGETCPECEAEMVVRYSKSGAFLSCGRFPDCKGTRPLDVERAEDEDGEEIECPDCGAPMRRKRSRYGMFLSCSNYPECKGNLPLDRDGKVIKAPPVDFACDKCGKPMVAKRSSRGFFAACTAYPDCKNTKPLDKDGKPIDLPEITAECDKCGKPMAVKMGRRGPFLSCTGYPDCKNAKPIDREGNIVELPKVTGTCEKCGGEMVVRSSRRGPFLGCAAYPKCRNAKPIPPDAEAGAHYDFSKMTEEELKAYQSTARKKSGKKKGAKEDADEKA